MHYSTFTTLAALATTAFAGTAVVQNSCSGTTYLTITTANQQSNTISIAPGQSYSAPIVGQGNSWGIHRNPEYFSSGTPKLIWGFSDAPPTLYYSLNTVDGNPFTTDPFTLSTSDASCGVTTSADARTRTCGDGATFTLKAC